MTNTKNEIHLEKVIFAQREQIFNLFLDNTVFRLTGANEIEVEYKVGGKFCLVFENRGSIKGRFCKLTDSEIILEWNVEGFNRPKETKTLVSIFLRQEDSFCILNLSHSNIQYSEAAVEKRRAWTEILEEIGQRVRNNR